MIFTPLGELIDIERGLTFKRSDTTLHSSNIVLTATNISLESGQVNLTELKYLKPTFEVDKKFKVERDSLLICLSSGSKKHLGKVALVENDIDVSFGGFIGKLSANELILPKYLFYSLRSREYQNFISNLTDGVNINNLKIKDLKSFKIPLASIEIQKKIVSKLDQAFEAIDQAIANTEKNIENVDELFQSQLDFLFSSKDDSWSTNSLSEIATLKYGYTEKSAVTGHYRYIRITDIDKQGKLRTESKQYLAYSLEAEEYLVKHNDLLMARTGATYGKVLLYDNIEPSVYASYLIRIDFNIPIDNEVYWFFTKSKSYWKQASQLSSGSAQPQFNGNALKKVSFSYPRHKDDQDILKEKCRAIFESTENLKQQYIAKLNELESLKMSILEKAFKGELV